MIRHISRLRLTAFRNYAAAALDLDQRHVVLTGPNGSGKTNLLEAIFRALARARAARGQFRYAAGPGLGPQLGRRRLYRNR
jgi:DNA replication and repair protein RecF